MSKEKYYYSVLGFYPNNSNFSKKEKYAKDLIGMFEGCILDSVDIQAYIKNPEEIDDFIRFLQDIKPCFIKPKKHFREPVCWDKLSLEERNSIVRDNAELTNTYEIKGETFAEGAFVKHKNNKYIRYITKDNDGFYFVDDGKISGVSPSEHCLYAEYEMI